MHDCGGGARVFEQGSPSAIERRGRDIQLQEHGSFREPTRAVSFKQAAKPVHRILGQIVAGFALLIEHQKGRKCKETASSRQEQRCNLAHAVAH